MYLALRSVGLDKSRVYNIREVTLDRAAFHITFDDGTIAFTEDVAGRVTGAFFEGEGEVLLIPRDQAERASMTLFTGAAILEEKFVTAYFRFNDDTFAELQPALRPAEHAQEFVTQWDSAARNLAQIDALRLLLSFSNSLPASGPEGAATSRNQMVLTDDDRMLHARASGTEARDIRSLLRLPGRGTNLGRPTENSRWRDLLRRVERVLPGPARRPLRRRRRSYGRRSQARGGQAFRSTRSRRKWRRPPGSMPRATLQLEVRQGGQRAVLFELSRFLQIRKVEADGQPVEFIHNQALEGTQLARRGNDLVAVIFPQPLRAGQQIALHFVYGGEVLSEAGPGCSTSAPAGPGIRTVVWRWPEFDLQFRYPAGWTLLATGKRMEGSTSELPPGEQSSHWVSDRPMPIAGFNLGKYSRVVAQAGEVQVEAYAASGVERTFPQGTTQTAIPQPLSPFPDP